jgi:MFS family permease
VKVSEQKGRTNPFFNIRTFSSLQNPVYRLYFFGMLGQFAAMNMQWITTSLLTFRLTGSPALLGSMALANAIPMIFISLFGGTIADRMQKRLVIIIGLVGTALVNVGIALALSTGALSQAHEGSWWILLLASFLSGIMMGLMMPARQAIIPEIVSREHAMNAVAMNMLGMNALTFVAPGIAGFLIDAFDFKAVYFVMAAMNVWAAVFVFFIRHNSRITRTGANIMTDMQEGFKYIRRDVTILLVLAFTLVVTVLSMSYSQLLPVFTDNILKVGATGMGVLMSVSGAGALIASLVMASLRNKWRGLMLLIGGLVSGIALVGFSFSSSWNFSLAFMVFVGVGQTIRGTVSGALLQSYTEPKYMGRVMAVFSMQWGVVNVCMFIAGLMAQVISVQWVVGGFAMALIVLTIMGMALAPRLRKLD